MSWLGTLIFVIILIAIALLMRKKPKNITVKNVSKSLSNLPIKIVIVALFIASYLVTLYSVSNKLGTFVPYTEPSGGTTRGYYTGFPTEAPFKVAITAITLGLFILLIRTIFTPGVRMFRGIGLFVGLIILAWWLSFILWFEF